MVRLARVLPKRGIAGCAESVDALSASCPSWHRIFAAGFSCTEIITVRRQQKCRQVQPRTPKAYGCAQIVDTTFGTVSPSAANVASNMLPRAVTEERQGHERLQRKMPRQEQDQLLPSIMCMCLPPACTMQVAWRPENAGAPLFLIPLPFRSKSAL